MSFTPTISTGFVWNEDQKSATHVKGRWLKTAKYREIQQSEKEIKIRGILNG